MAKSSTGQMKEDEAKILAALQKFSKENIDEIAKHCGFSRQKVWRYIKRLEENRFIWGYAAVVDGQKLGHQKFMLLLKRSLQALENKTADDFALNRFENTNLELGVTIQSSYYLHGEYDWAIIFTAPDITHAKNFSNLMLKKYPGIIANMYLNQILFTEREHYVLNPNPMKLGDFL
jgi:DNA-binding Lrp family transcriptional regulator